MRHHPKGPSRQKNFDLCCGYQPKYSDHENKVLGSVCHEIWDTGNKELANKLADPEFALQLVRDIQEEWEIVEGSFKREFGRIRTSGNEVLLESKSLNFGTTDRLRLARTAALLGDGKFGWWKVDHAEDNLQGHNYAVLVWELWPEINDLWIWFGNPRLQDYTLAKFTRDKHYKPFREALAKRLGQEPDPMKFHYDRTNCSFCSRWDCGARLQRMRDLKAYLEWESPKTMTNEILAKIKAELNGIKSLIKGVDEEAKHRVFDDGETLTGFEMKERVQSREVIGLKHLFDLTDILQELGQHKVATRVSEIMCVSYSDVEQIIIHEAGGYRDAKPILAELKQHLEENKALTTNSYYVVAAKNDETKED